MFMVQLFPSLHFLSFFYPHTLPDVKERSDPSDDKNDSSKLQISEELKGLATFDDEGSNLFAQDNNIRKTFKLPLPKKLESLGPRNGLIKDYFEDGSIKTNFVDGVKEGSRKVWYANDIKVGFYEGRPLAWGI